MQSNAFEMAIARKFRLDRAPTLFARLETAAPVAITRLSCSDIAARGATLAAPPEEAYSFFVSLTEAPQSELWLDGRYVYQSGGTVGAISLYDLSTSIAARLTPPYDFLRFHLPVAALDRIAYERGLRRPHRLRTPSIAQPDPVLFALAQSVLQMIEAPEAGSTLFLDAVALAFHAHVVQRYGGPEPAAESGRSGLAPWQLRRAYEFIEAHIEGDPSIEELAQECRLSASHFARAFRQSTGQPPHRWLMRRRVERAKQLLTEGEMPLAEVALICGFVDQSHLSRVFTRAEGHTPGKWRRLRAS
ncbi:MAG: AraC family transcriptional regulator [Aliidongia sp.]